jgi:hypothetical protein
MAQAIQTDTAAEQARDHMLRLLIAEQNDAFRRCLGFAALWRDHHLKGRAVVTPGFEALPVATKSALMGKVINFTDFTEENDPWEDHSFGRVEAEGAAIFWKIDLYDTAYTFGATMPDCACDPDQTRRVLTLFLPSEH